MSICGETTAVVSVGVSCQTAHQIHVHAELLSDLLGEAMERSRFPFDWLIAPVLPVAGMVRARLPLPEDPAELEVSPRSGSTAVWWPAQKFYFWHDFDLPGSGIDLAATFEATLQKFRHTRHKFLRLDCVARRIFVLSNTQNNLSVVARNSGRVDFTITLERLEAMQAALDACFPTGRNELLVATAADRVSAAALRSRWRPWLMELTDGSWRGEPAAWEAFFRHRLTPPGRETDATALDEALALI